ncbi:hypothetical protein ACLOJK_014113 [Asimina triloba]
MPALARDIPFYALLIESCSSGKELITLRKIHARILTVGIAHHDFLRAKLVSSYASCSCMREAAHVFSRTNRQSTFLYNSMIKGYASLGLHSQSLVVFTHMIRCGKLLDRHTLPSVLKACAGLSSLRLGRQVHVAVLVRGFAPDVAACNSLVAMYGRSGDLASARRVFDQMPERNAVSWSAIIGAYGQHGLSGEAVRLFDEMMVAGESPDEVAFTAVLSACSHGRLMEEGWRVWGMMMEGRFGVRRRLEHYTCMVDMLGRAGHVEEAEALIGGMEGEPDEALWNALLGACRLHGKVEVAERVAERVYGGKIGF